jgi:hypothetical protein
LGVQDFKEGRVEEKRGRSDDFETEPEGTGEKPHPSHAAETRKSEGD